LLELDSSQIGVKSWVLRGKILEEQWFGVIKTRCAAWTPPTAFFPYLAD